MSRVNETKCLVHYESCECKGRLNENVCNSKQIWSHNELQCQCKELDEKYLIFKFVLQCEDEILNTTEILI